MTDVLSTMDGAGLSHARVQVQWRWIEPADVSPPLRHWGGIDPLVQRLDAEGIGAHLNLLGNPDWAASTACGPVDIAPLVRWRDFVEAIVERYDADGVADAPGSPRVDRWEIGNEPDFAPSRDTTSEGNYGSCFGDGDADAFGDLLRAAWQGAKAADATAELVFGGVAHDRFYNGPGYPPGNAGPFDYDFVGDVLDHLYSSYGHEPDFPFADAIGIHVYNDFRTYWDGTAPFEQELVGKVARFRTQQLHAPGEYDLRGYPIAVTEVSLPSLPADPWTYRDEAVQAHYPGRVLARAAAAGVDSVTWFSVEDHRIGRCDDALGYSWLAVGLLRAQAVFDALQACVPVPDYGAGYAVTQPHEPKPALDAAAVALEQMAGLRYDRQLERAETGNVRIEAHRLLDAGGSGLLVAFTDTGYRIGHRSHPDVTRILSVDAELLPGWTGAIAVTDHLGSTSILTGTAINVTLGQAPRYIRPHGEPPVAGRVQGCPADRWRTCGCLPRGYYCINASAESLYAVGLPR